MAGISPCMLKAIPADHDISTAKTCEMVKAELACYSAGCCEVDLYKMATDALITLLPEGCTAKCGAGAMATPAAALVAVVMAMFYRLM
jgi:hypothetical protein